MNFKRQDIGLGLFVLGAAAAVIAGLITVAGILKGETINIHFRVDSMTNINVGNDVYVRGYKVGGIARIEHDLEPTLHFNVTVAIDADFPLYEGTRAEIGAQAGFIGGAVVNLKLPDERGRRLIDGDNIGTATTVDATAILSKADSLAVAAQEIMARMVDLLSPEIAGALLEELRLTVVTTRESLVRLEGRFLAISDSLARGMELAANSLELVNGILMENRPRIATMLDSTQILIGEMRKLTTSTNSLLETQGPVIGRNLEQLEAVMAEFRIFLADLNRHTLWQMLFKVRHPDSSAVER